MSINILTQIIEEGFSIPKDILAEVDHRIIRSLRQHDESVKDGMDIAMCLVEGTKIVFSSTHISMYRISKGELHQYRGSSVYLGDGDTSRLESVEIQCEKGDLLYMFTDGYADQKGGAGNRKFYSKTVQDMVLENNSLPLKKQLALFERTFIEWKGKNQQVDDVSVFGFKI
jgi:serine phosphatase RsbU (regulator of sigma subunit)